MPNQRLLSSPFRPSCFRPTTTSAIVSGNPTLSTTLYRTEFGLFTLTWSRNRSFTLHLHLHDDDSATPSPSFHLQVKPFFTFFWKNIRRRRGSKKLSKTARVYWDLSRAKFGSSSKLEPLSGTYYITVLIDGETALLVDGNKQDTVMKKERVYGNRSLLLYTTKASFCGSGKEREVSIECCRLGDGEEDPKLELRIDNKSVLQIKKLQWKFRGNERVEVDGIQVQVSWDVHSWLFRDVDDNQLERGDEYAVFMLKFDQKSSDELLFEGCDGSGRSWSSSSLSSGASSSSSGSVMDWTSAEEHELRGPPAGFSLVVYACKS